MYEVLFGALNPDNRKAMSMLFEPHPVRVSRACRAAVASPVPGSQLSLSSPGIETLAFLEEVRYAAL